MKKIGILTFNRPINYGAVLQAFALKNTLSSYAKTEVINYLCPAIEEEYNPLNNSIVNRIIRNIFFGFGKRDKKFKKFIKQLNE